MLLLLLLLFYVTASLGGVEKGVVIPRKGWFLIWCGRLYPLAVGYKYPFNLAAACMPLGVYIVYLLSVKWCKNQLNRSGHN